MTTAIIFDLDGLLIDSEAVHFEAYRDLFRQYDIELTEEMFVDYWLSGTKYGTKYFLGEMKGLSQEAIEEAREWKARRYVEIAPGRLTFMPGAEALLQELVRRGIPAGVATGSYAPEYQVAIETLNLDRYVQTILGGNEVKRNKPAPDLFLEVAKRLGANPQECLVLENSSTGIISAGRANMRSVAIPSPFTARQDFSEATYRFDSLSKMDLDALLKSPVT